MHMTDALVSPAVGLTMAAVGVAAVGISVVKIKKDELSEKKIPLMGVAGALVFAAQMINFTIPATGSSGHIGGGILLAGLLGGIPSFLSITVVLTIQCLFFADGGLLALGCNIFNLGVIPCLLIYPLVFKPIIRRRIDNKSLSVASVASAASAMVLGAFCVTAQTVLSGISGLPFDIFASLMLPIHLIIGLVEGIITAAVLCFIHKMRPEIIESALKGERVGGVPVKNVIVAVFSLALITGGALVLFASAKPDGLEWAVGKTAERVYGREFDAGPEGEIHNAAAGVQERTAFLPDYAFVNDSENAAGKPVAGITGAVAIFVTAGAAGLVISKIKKSKKAVSDG